MPDRLPLRYAEIHINGYLVLSPPASSNSKCNS